ncbi:MAG: tRNA uridine-5-carboxymethylaminomethyl(34) synthesis enzyme MnmG [Candidatus Dependentiae bacterium]|nr:tRNA uridine-5-carboxymethylaminomethyl(34) synthesis enzyme MnmG [Candidatus Dependentiae bacterium]
MNQTMSYDFDVIVVGGGHAGIEAAHAAAKMGSKTLLVTINLDTIGLMPCNPAVGGVGKGHIVYELSALGGLMPKLCTKTYLQARMLNTRKGPAVQGLRLQIDKYAYNKLSKEVLERIENLTLRMGMVEEILIDDARNIRGIKTRDGSEYLAPTLIITTGTFLNGKIHIGPTNYPAGRQGEEAALTLSFFLEKMGIKLGRLKTGTPPRLLRSSIDFSKMTQQEPDNLNYLFEFYPHSSVETRPCFITETNARTHEIIRKNLHLSAMYSGNIQGIGPRYCPSIEDKISRFADKTSHHIFVEPEGASSEEIYPNGLSTSLPVSVQKEYIQSIAGFEQAVITRPGYAVEYDFVMPNQLHHTLEVKTVGGLFLAGQINGTTGYEEAAGQGIVAGINAHLKVKKQEPFILDRTESYIGVMIDDLITFSVDEPYRMFTSRAERRLLLRQDNAFLRLTDRAYKLGMIDEQLYRDFKQEKDIINQTLTDLRAGQTNTQLLKLFGELECNAQAIKESTTNTLSDRSVQTIYAEVRYEPYLKREEKEVEKTKAHQELIIPATLDYIDMPGLSRELQQKLTKYKPHTIAQASLIQGITPAAISLLIFKIRNMSRSKNIVESSCKIG